MLIDEVKIKVKAGDGGRGIISFCHEKYRPKGGPDGGDGGKGGDIIFRVDNNVNTLTFFNTRKEFCAPNGDMGHKNKSTGKSAQDLFLTVPQGTLIYEIDGNKHIKIADLTETGKNFRVAKGGKGGLGNYNFCSSTNQAPRIATNGEAGEEKTILLELRMIADVGLIGLPNAGKSTLLSKISHARPKIADYPFTTLEPNLGIASIDNFSFTIADIPGLIAGASGGKGLGHKFLRHIKRTKLLVHLIDITSLNIKADYKTIRQELKEYDKDLSQKPEIIAINKIDLISSDELLKIKTICKTLKPHFISTASGEGIQKLLYEIKNKLKKILPLDNNK